MHKCTAEKLTKLQNTIAFGCLTLTEEGGFPSIEIGNATREDAIA